MSEMPIPVFILGSGRSGTTITAALLNHLPGVHISKESGFLGQHLELLEVVDEPAPRSRLLDVTNSWLTQNGWEQRATETGFREFCDRYRLSGPAAYLHYVWQLESPVPWHELRFIGDNTPLYVMAIPAIQRLLPDARFIHMVRDPRDVVCSIVKMRFGAYDVVMAALEWHVYLGCWLMAERGLPAHQRFECRYEDLCTSPDVTFTRLAAFVGCSGEAAAAALAQHARGGAGALSGFERVATQQHHTRLSEPLSAQRVGRYRQELTAKQVRQIEEIAQYGMLAYGYEPTRWQMHPLMLEHRFQLLKAMVSDMCHRVIARITGK
jgi:hypothetical protein